MKFCDHLRCKTFFEKKNIITWEFDVCAVWCCEYSILEAVLITNMHEE